MKRPTPITLLLGSRFTAPPIMLGSAYVTYRWWEAGGYGILGFLTIGLILACIRAVGTCAAYRRWRADWQAMAPGGDTKRRWVSPTRIAQIVVFTLVGLCAYWASGPDSPPELHDHYALWVIGYIAAAGVFLLGRCLWRLARSRQAATMPTVTLAIRGPVLPVCSLATCYGRLPPYCQVLLDGSRP